MNEIRNIKKGEKVYEHLSIKFREDRNQLFWILYTEIGTYCVEKGILKIKEHILDVE